MYLGIEDGFGVALELGEEGDDAKAGVVLEVEFAECHPAVDEQDLAVHQGRPAQSAVVGSEATRHFSICQAHLKKFK